MTEDPRRQTRAVWGAAPAGAAHAPGEEPGTRVFFEKVMAARFGREMRFLREVVPYSTFSGRRILEIGCGAGYDAYELIRHGGSYTGIDLVPANIQRTRSHLALFGIRGELGVADAEALPFGDAIFDVVFSNGVLHHTPDIGRAIQEARRVLKVGGECWVLLYHRDSVFYWLTLGLSDHILRGGFRQRRFRDRLRMIENPGVVSELPLVNVYSRHQVRAMFADFREVRTWVRKLTVEDLPWLPKLGTRPWTWIPQPTLDLVGKAVGWYIIARAVKA